MLQRLIRLGAERRVITLDLLKRTQTVIHTGIHVHDIQARLDQFDRGQNAIPMQSFGIQFGRLIV